MRVATWNVNGLRACGRHGFGTWLDSHRLDAVCLQEVKALPEDVTPALREPKGYTSFWHPAEKLGYSGVLVYSRREPLSVTKGLGIPAIDREGRVLQVEYPGFVLVNAYFPNSGRDLSRLPYKLAFCKAMHKRLDRLVAQGKNVVVCGDWNIAHTEIDLTNPTSNKNNAGFLPEERGWMSSFLKRGYVDAFRLHNPHPGPYTWWSYRPGVRAKNVGWRLDCFATNRDHADRVKKTVHQTEVYGSDHCPVVLHLKD